MQKGAILRKCVNTFAPHCSQNTLPKQVAYPPKHFNFKKKKKKEEIQIAKISGWMGEARSMVQLEPYEA